VFVENKNEDKDIEKEKDVYIKLHKLYNKNYINTNAKQKLTFKKLEPNYIIYGFKL
jgi:hypothetical protein